MAKDDCRMFLPAAALEEMVAGAGFTPEKTTITYCQGGIRAAHAAFVLELLGWDNIRVYDGSMRDWAVCACRAGPLGAPRRYLRQNL